jgi:hypothetical protein
MPPQIEKDYVESLAVQISPQGRHLKPGAPHSVHKHDEVPPILGRKIPPAQRDSVLRPRQPRLGCLIPIARIDPGGVIGGARQAIGSEYRNPDIDERDRE